MPQLKVDKISNMLEKALISDIGVSFKGRALVLDKEADWSGIVDAINNCKNLEVLNLEGNSLGVEASKAIGKALESKPELKRALWKDIFTGRMKGEIPKALVNLGTGLTLAGARLTELDMSDNAFGPIGIEGLVGLLSSPTCFQLQELRLNNNGLGTTGGKMLAEALLYCYKNSLEEGKPFALKVFIAGRNRLENAGATAIAKVFKTLGSLEEVALPQNGIYSEGIKALSESFVNNKNLKIINLNDNTLNKTGAVSVARALPHLQKLKILNLGDCLLKTKGAEVLAEALEKNHSDLEELYMCSNEIKRPGGLALARAMKNKKKLKILSLDGNCFGNEGCANIRDAMKEISRTSCLQSLSEDEGDDNDEVEDEEEENNETGEDGVNVSGSEHDDKENEYNRSSEADESNIISPNLTSTPKVEKNDSEFLRHNFQNMSLDQTAFDSVYKFLEFPVMDNLKEIDKKVMADYMQKIQASSPDSYCETLLQIIMKISQLVSCSRDEGKTLVMEISFDLYEKLFSWAGTDAQLSAVNNFLVVYLGLIKSEDKNFKINWNLDGCLSVLKSVISKGIVPESTRQILQCCMNSFSITSP